ncbi:MAG: efflux RND transporter periplasmic adaptor subunit [Desulforhabdus sp.]|nr:efflux RND transporter periplasmic adaptor subunit [Desulforhabdus sp.]
MADEGLSKLRIEKTSMPSHRKKVKRYGLLLMLFALLITVGSLYQAGFLTPSVEVQVAVVQKYYPSQMFTLLNASGYVVAQRKAAVASKITSQLVYLGVEEGSRVKEGQVIARLENLDAEAARDRAKAELEAAKYSLQEARAELRVALLAYQRKKQVVHRGYVSELEYAEAEARYRRSEETVAARQAQLEARESALREAQALVSYAEIQAPFDAVVLTKDADVGDIVTPLGAAANAKAAVVTIADLDSLKVEADVSESNIEKVKVGQPCEIQLDALPDSRFRGVVHMIVPTADRSKATVMVKVAFMSKDPRILPEMSAKVAFLTQKVPEKQEPFTAIPSLAVVRRDDRSVVYAVREGRAAQVNVQLEEEYGEMVSVHEGLEVGEKVIVTPDKVEDGSKVTVPE